MAKAAKTEAVDTAIIEVPVCQLNLEAYVSDYFEGRMTPRQGAALKMITESLDKRCARLKPTLDNNEGLRVTKGVHAIKWLLEQIATSSEESGIRLSL